MRKIFFNLMALACFTIIFSCQQKNTVVEDEQASTNYLNESPEDFNNRMEWWRDARFGMFIHWGAYAVPAGMYDGKEVKGIGEWIMKHGQIPIGEYEQFARQFNPVKFDAEEWVQIAKNAGMKYIVITSKHHDGFALWDSEVSDYNIVDYGSYGKDVLKALSSACKKEGIALGFYHSIMDWHHPDAQSQSYLMSDSLIHPKGNPDFPRYLEEYMKPQVKELIDNFDPAILWFDGEWTQEFTHEQGLELYQYVRSLKPEILINNRVDTGRRGMQGMNEEGDDYAGDFGTPEQEILEGTSVFDWESCMTMNDTWGFKVNDHNWKSAELLIHNLIDVTAKGGNYLLNVGPTAEGEIPKPSVERLKEMGDWLGINGEAIYNTEKLNRSYKEGENIRYIKRKGEQVFYAVSFEKPGPTISFNKLMPNEGSSIYLLGFGQPLEWTFSEDDGLKIQIPQDAISALNYAWTFKMTGEERGRIAALRSQ